MIIVNVTDDSIVEPAMQADTKRALTINELEAVSGGCPCTTPCPCDKPSPRHYS
jgi:hypothetical protein